MAEETLANAGKRLMRIQAVSLREAKVGTRGGEGRSIVSIKDGVVFRVQIEVEPYGAKIRSPTKHSP